MKIFPKILFALTLFMIVMCIPVLVHAQISDPSCDPVDLGCPIDGGLSGLIIAGVFYGIKRVKNFQKAEI